jgi:hypothetical protein
VHDLLSSDMAGPCYPTAGQHGTSTDPHSLWGRWWHKHSPNSHALHTAQCVLMSRSTSEGPYDNPYITASTMVPSSAPACATLFPMFCNRELSALVFPATNVLLYKSTFVLQSSYFAKHLKSWLQSNQRHAIFIDSWIFVLLYF